MKTEEKIQSKLQVMNQYLDDLDGILPSSKEEYLQDLKTRRACEKTIEAAIEIVIDTLAVLVSDFKLGIPDSEDSIVEIAGKKNVLSPVVLAKIKLMKGFRNILVHKYGEINDEQVYSFLTSELDDFSLFEQEIKKYLKKKR